MSKNKPTFEGTKVYHIYSKLDHEQCQRFHDFIKSPYHNSSKRLIHYWACFEKFSKSSNKDTTLVAFYKKLHPQRFPKGKLADKQVDDIAGKIKRLNTEIWGLLRTFLGLEEYRKQPLLSSKHIYEGFANLKPEGGYQDYQFDAIEKKIEDSDISGYRLSLQHQLWADQLSLRHSNINRSMISVFEKTVNTLDEYYFTQRIFYELELHMLRNQFDRTPKAMSLEAVIPLFRDRIETLNPLAQGGYYLYLALKESEDLSHFERLLTHISQYEEKIEETSIRNLATGMINLLIQLNNRSKKYQKILLDSYLTLLEKDWLSIEGRLELRNFNNVITLLLQEDDFTRADKIFSDWKSKIMTDSPEFALSFNRGKILLEKYEQLKFLPNSEREELLEQAKRCFHQVYQNYTSDNDFLYDFNARLLMYRVYYLKKSWETIEERYFNFKQHIREHAKASQIHRDSGTNFIKFVYRLYKLNILEKPYTDQLAKLKDEIEQEPRLAMKPWLLDQIKELYEN